VTRHARQVHNGPKPLGCPYCQYKTADRSNYKKHVELHLNPRQFHCPLCKYAASKKCNLQYHMKSRHVGCDIHIDVSKVKLRAKKGGEESEVEPAGQIKSTKAKSTDDEEEEEEDNDYNSDEEACMNRQVAAAAVSRSAKKSGRSAQAAENEAETDRGVQRRAKSTGAADKGTGAPEGKEKAVRKVTTRQKKVTRVSESTKETSAVEAGSPAESPAAPVKRSSKKKNKKKRLLEEEEKLSDRSGSEVAEPEGKDERAEPTNGEQVALRRSMEELKKLQKEKRMEKARKVKQEKDEQKAGVKTNGRLQSRRTGTRKSGPASEKPTEDVPMGSDHQEIPDTDKREGKVKAVRRKAAEALDLSTKHYSPKTEAAGSPSPKRCKTSAADKPATKPRGSTVVSQAAEPWPALEKDPQVKGNAPSPVKLKKTRKTNKKTPVLQDSPASTKEAQDSAARDTLTPPPDLQSAVAQATPPAPDTNPQENPTEPPPPLVAQMTDVTNTAPEETAPSAPEKKSPAEDISMDTEVPSTSYSSGEETTPSPVTDRPPAPPTFRRPDAKAPPRPSLELPRHAEEDEGIHSSHEGASDVSDSASEGGSEDSGLNSAGAGSGKMANDPETPTDEIPTPTELKSHLCVFCDRTFPMEVEYRRHVNRHLVNVYYMDGPAAKGGK